MTISHGSTAIASRPTRSDRKAPPDVGHGVSETMQDEQRVLWLRSLLCGICLCALIGGWIVSARGEAIWGVAAYLVAYAAGGVFPMVEAVRALRRRAFDVNLLMVLAAIGAAAVGEWREGAVLMFLFSLSGTLESYAMGHSRRAIRALMRLSPEVALVRRDGEERTLPVEALVIGDIVIVHPGERIPADGTVFAGFSAVDQAPITGESVPVEKVVGATVFAATINGDGALEVVVTALAHESTLARVIRLVEQAQADKAPTQRLTEWVGTRYTVAVLIVVALAIFVPPLVFAAPWEAAFYRAMTLMTVASPCALVLSTPAAILSAISTAARRGVLFKGGGALEALGQVNAIAFDKTGTLTFGSPRVAALLPAAGVSEAELLSVAAAVETRSEHPLARAVVAHAVEREISLPPIEGFQAVVGYGARALVAGEVALIGATRLFDKEHIVIPPDAQERADTLRAEGQTVVFVAHGSRYLGCVALSDAVRPTAIRAINALRALGVRHVVMLTGDHAAVAGRVAAQLGIDEVQADLLPADKLRVIRELQEQYGKVAMIGDGVNDAPALAAATVGIAMGGGGTDVALETADVALMGDNLAALVEGVSLSRRARRIVRQNVTIALGVIAVLVVVAAFGLIRLPVAVIGHEGSTLIVVANGLRLLTTRRVGQ